MERRRELRSAHDVWPDHHRLTRIGMTRVRVRSPMTRSERRLTLMIWTISICTAVLTLSELLALVTDLMRALLAAI